MRVPNRVNQIPEYLPSFFHFPSTTPTSFSAIKIEFNRSKSSKKTQSMATPTSQLILETSDLVKIFNRFDANNDGKISASELESVLEALGSSTSPEEVQTLMAQIDSDGDGFINLEEFAEFYAGGTGGERSASEELKEAFEAYDADRNGQISAAELHMVLLKLGESCSVEDCERMIVCVDSDGDGSVSFEEFVGMMNGGRAVSN